MMLRTPLRGAREACRLFLTTGTMERRHSRYDLGLFDDSRAFRKELLLLGRGDQIVFCSGLERTWYENFDLPREEYPRRRKFNHNLNFRQGRLMGALQRLACEIDPDECYGVHVG